MDKRFRDQVAEQIKNLTGVENPNSSGQLREWISNAKNEPVKSLAKDAVESLLAEVGPESVIGQVLTLRKYLSKSSTKKYVTMKRCMSADRRIRGLFQHYGANRTGRWAGRLVQLQNLPRNYLKIIDKVRDVVARGEYTVLEMMYDNISNILSQLIRTSFIAPIGQTLAVADFSAIEARVTAWFADETWRLDIFNTHGKIYEASASKMFNVPIEQITKGSELRTKGKIAELALGYQGALGALKKMGGEEMGLTDNEMLSIVKKWRKSNKNIVSMWYDFNDCAWRAIKFKKRVISKYRKVEFESDGEVFTIKLPSGRKLYYQRPSVEGDKIYYYGLDENHKWAKIPTYGGKLTENIVQATSRDLLANSMLTLEKFGFPIVLHVHDEVAVQILNDEAEEDFNSIMKHMSSPVPWAPGLPMKADGYTTDFYKKD